MNQEQKLWVSLVNVPKEMTTTDTVSIFVELRSEVFGFNKTNGDAIVISRINNLSFYDAISIKWGEFWVVAEKLARDHFADFKEVVA